MKTEPHFVAPIIKLRQPDGSLLVKAGNPQHVEAEISTTAFSKVTGMSQRWAELLCEAGHIKHRRLSPKPRSKILIPRSEVERYRKIESEALEASKTSSPHARVPKAARNAPTPARSAADSF